MEVLNLSKMNFIFKMTGAVQLLIINFNIWEC